MKPKAQVKQRRMGYLSLVAATGFLVSYLPSSRVEVGPEKQNPEEFVELIRRGALEEREILSGIRKTSAPAQGDQGLRAALIDRIPSPDFEVSEVARGLLYNQLAKEKEFLGRVNSYCDSLGADPIFLDGCIGNADDFGVSGIRDYLILAKFIPLGLNHFSDPTLRELVAHLNTVTELEFVSLGAGRLELDEFPIAKRTCAADPLKETCLDFFLPSKKEKFLPAFLLFEVFSEHYSKGNDRKINYHSLLNSLWKIGEDYRKAGKEMDRLSLIRIDAMLLIPDPSISFPASRLFDSLTLKSAGGHAFDQVFRWSPDQYREWRELSIRELRNAFLGRLARIFDVKLR